jgi:delta-aminolevulinic acid dehydratase/porphobilinogen synthase
MAAQNCGDVSGRRMMNSRSGADLIVTYFAKDAAKLLN